MRFCITDDDSAIRSTLSQLIEDEDLGEVVEEVVDGSFLDASTLNLKQIDILFIDLLMPGRDGIETIRHLKDSFKGKMIMISQVESKELIGEAYSEIKSNDGSNTNRWFDSRGNLSFQKESNRRDIDKKLRWSKPKKNRRR